jgi:translation initiation factor IF-1
MGSDEAVDANELASGTVVELLESMKVRVELEDRRRVVAHAGAGSRMNFVRLRPGDQVAVAISPHDAGRGRIVKKLEPQAGGKRRGIVDEARTE